MDEKDEISAFKKISIRGKRTFKKSIEIQYDKHNIRLCPNYSEDTHEGVYVLLASLKKEFSVGHCMMFAELDSEAFKV